MPPARGWIPAASVLHYVRDGPGPRTWVGRPLAVVSCSVVAGHGYRLLNTYSTGSPSVAPGPPRVPAEHRPRLVDRNPPHPAAQGSAAAGVCLVHGQVVGQE